MQAAQKHHDISQIYMAQISAREHKNVPMETTTQLFATQRQLTKIYVYLTNYMSFLQEKRSITGTHIHTLQGGKGDMGKKRMHTRWTYKAPTRHPSTPIGMVATGRRKKNRRSIKNHHPRSNHVAYMESIQQDHPRRPQMESTNRRRTNPNKHTQLEHIKKQDQNSTEQRKTTKGRNNSQNAAKARKPPEEIVNTGGNSIRAAGEKNRTAKRVMMKTKGRIRTIIFQAYL